MGSQGSMGCCLDAGSSRRLCVRDQSSIHSKRTTGRQPRISAYLSPSKGVQNSVVEAPAMSEWAVVGQDLSAGGTAPCDLYHSNATRPTFDSDSNISRGEFRRPVEVLSERGMLNLKQ